MTRRRRGPAHRPVPVELRTARLLLRPWRAGDALALRPVLLADQEHLGPWIPRNVAEAAPLPELRRRLERFAADFATDREWRYALFSADGATPLGEVGLYPRGGEHRVAYAESTHGEIGYWLRSDATGRGFATEATRAVLAVAESLVRLAYLEIRCDARNMASGAVPRRLGFELTATVEEPGVLPEEPAIALQVWTLRRSAG